MIIYDKCDSGTTAFLTRINTILPMKLLLDGKVNEWWKCVFTQRDGRVVYDNYYDHYRIAEDSSMTFGTLLPRIEEILRSCASTELRLSSVWTDCRPLRYVYEKVEASAGLRIEWLEGDVWHLSDGDVVMEEGDEPMTVYVPMLQETLSQMATDRKTWAEVIGDTKEEYSVGGIPMKRLEVRG